MSSFRNLFLFVTPIIALSQPISAIMQ